MNLEKTLKAHGYSPRAIKEILHWYGYDFTGPLHKLKKWLSLQGRTLEEPIEEPMAIALEELMLEEEGSL